MTRTRAARKTTANVAIPARRAGDGRLPVPGWVDRYEWDGLVPYASLPRIQDPPEAFVADNGKMLWRFYTVPGNPKDGFEQAGPLLAPLQERRPKVDVEHAEKLPLVQAHVGPQAPALLTTSDTQVVAAAGLVDGDGDLDLAVGNYAQPNRLYRNDSPIAGTCYACGTRNTSYLEGYCADLGLREPPAKTFSARIKKKGGRTGCATAAVEAGYGWIPCAYGTNGTVVPVLPVAGI